MEHTIAIKFSADALPSYTDSFLAALWHLAQANPAPIDDREAGDIAEKIGREIIRRFLAATPPELWAHQGLHHLQMAACRQREATTASDSRPPAIGEHWEAGGGIYAGVMRGQGAPDYHLVLLDGEREGVDWNEAQRWATEDMAGFLPTRPEQALLYANLKDRFQPAWYWSGEKHASDSDCAWGQYFDDGYQSCSSVSSGGRARAVRRLPI